MARAADAFDPAARAAAIAPFLDETTVVIGHVDLSRVEAGPIMEKCVELVPRAAGWWISETAAEMTGTSGAVASGFNELYLVVSLADLLPGTPFLIAPGADDAKMAALEAWPELKTWGTKAGDPKRLEKINSPLLDSDNNVMGYVSVPRRAETVGDALYMGSQRAFERLKHATRDKRRESQLQEAFSAAGDTAANCYSVPPAYAGRVIEEMMPELPKEFGGGPSTVLTRGLQWAAVGFDGPPEMSLRLAVESQDSAAAAKLCDWAVERTQLLAERAKTEDIRRVYSRAGEIVKPKIDGGRLTLEFSAQNGALAGLLEAVARDRCTKSTPSCGSTAPPKTSRKWLWRCTTTTTRTKLSRPRRSATPRGNRY